MWMRSSKCPPLFNLCRKIWRHSFDSIVCGQWTHHKIMRLGGNMDKQFSFEAHLNLFSHLYILWMCNNNNNKGTLYICFLSISLSLFSCLWVIIAWNIIKFERFTHCWTHSILLFLDLMRSVLRVVFVVVIGLRTRLWIFNQPVQQSTQKLRLCSQLCKSEEEYVTMQLGLRFPNDSTLD